MNDLPPSRVVAQMLFGHMVTQALYVVARLGIADILATGPADAAALAIRTSTEPSALYRLLRTLASMQIFREDDAGKFHLTPLADCLRKDAPDSQWALAMMAGEEQFAAWGALLHSVQTGRCAFEKVFGKPLFEYLAEHPEKARIFDAAMTSVHGPESAAMLDAYDFSAVRSLIDVGGGNGKTLLAVLERHPHLTGTLFDLPHVVNAAAPVLQASAVAQRCATAGGSFFAEVPAGADAYLLRHIIHDWYDEQSTQILQTCRRAMQPHARLLIVETVIPPGNEPSAGKMLDLAMMALPGGKERTEPEYRALLAGADLQLTSITPTTADVSVIEARPK